ncbi:MAG: hypothetical protein DME19_08350 [Verrucomicrobia bacterium]|nr:MAG: hypothetical protein DME19_08350 [Verrucomicrobiota bacterium]
MNCAQFRRNLTGILLLSSFISTGVAATSSDKISYNRDIRPVLSDNCFFCHGPDKNKRKGKLRLDVREEAIAKLAIVPGKPDESELIKRVFTNNADDLMPPPESHKILAPAQKQLFRRWIAQGAEYQKHWAYMTPVKPSVPSGMNGIDFLVQKRLKEIGLKPSLEAEPRRLARRLFFDLVGLPPRSLEVAAFEADKSSDAYETLVEQLLASPHYGERMAIGWLDVVRFADTIGYHSDNPRNIWPYRDYVIRSFNENKRFDEFTREQLAGDLLARSGLEEKVGSGFNRLLLSTEEGGAQPRDYEARMLTDRVRAVGTVWLGQTIGCAQCHDHKFDPITSRDFYSLGAFFADIKEPIIGRREDGMLVPDEKQAAELARLDSEVMRRQKEYEAPRPELTAKWEQAALEAIAAETHWTLLAPETMVSQSGVKLTADNDRIISTEKEPKDGKDTYRVTVKTSFKDVAGFRLEALSAEKLPGNGPGRAGDGNFILTEFSVEDANTNKVALSEAAATYEAEGFPAATAIDGEHGENNGWAIHGVTGVEQAIYFATKEPMSSDGEARVTFVIQQTGGSNQVLGRFRLAATTNLGVVRAPKTALPQPEIVEVLKLTTQERTDEQKQKLAAYQRSAAPELIEQRRVLAGAKKAKGDFEATVPRCLVSVAAEEPRTVRILPRGNWMIETGETVPPALPAYLTASARSAGDRRLNRLDLAEWIVSRENPLTARVFVNRLWKQFFGTGLSKVLDDFGMQGEPPVNPELLDWLACEFMDSGWDVKHMVRVIVNSHSYKQVSSASKQLQTRDPYNRELARQSRWRIEAELVRDNALSIAGLLVPKVGGPSVKPYQPDGYWENLNFPVRTYEADKGESQYRRGLYVWWQRSFLHPSLLAFDAPSREECAAERNRSNIPQQALVLLNDPTYVEAARAFAARILGEGGADTTARITWAWQQALSRAPRPDEMSTARALLDKHLAEYRRDAQAADSLLKVGLSTAPKDVDPAELAAWTNVARVILNLHETITRS